MPGVSREQVEAARGVDLLSYLRANEPDNLRRVGGEYCLRDHDSLKISNGMWHWHSRGVGDRGTLDYLIKVRGLDFVAAVERLCDGRNLPARDPNEFRVAAYLQSRGIGKDLIRRCVHAGILYESAPYHNAVFVGRDRDGEPRFACARGTLGGYRRDIAGSDKRFGFQLPPESEAGSGTLAVFESPIDALSHAELTGDDCRRLSLTGTAHTALMHFLEEAHKAGSPDIRRVSLCLDNDAAGLTAAAGMKYLIGKDARFSHVDVTHDPPPLGKDYNEALLETRRAVRHQPERECRNDGGPVL